MKWGCSVSGPGFRGRIQGVYNIDATSKVSGAIKDILK